jgi:tetratricopeptide (TPR) repeat protein
MNGLPAAVSEEKLTKASRRFAVVSGLGILLILLALGYSAYELNRFSIEIAARSAELASVKEEVESTRSQLAAAREAVSLVSTGINYFHAGMYPKAITAYDGALRLDPTNPYIANLKGYSLFKANKFDESLQALQQAVRIDSKYAWGFFDIARVYCAKKDFMDAQNAASEAIKIRPDLKETMLSDGEFTQLCRPILGVVQQYNVAK